MVGRKPEYGGTRSSLLHTPNIFKMKIIQILNLMGDLNDIKVCSLNYIKASSLHKTWNFIRFNDGIKITGNIDEYSFNEIMNLLLKEYSYTFVQCFLEEGYIYIK